MLELENTYSNRWLSTVLLDLKKIAIKTYDLIDILSVRTLKLDHYGKPLYLQPVFKRCKFYPHSDVEIVSEVLLQEVFVYL